jgi:hypothetical protein
LFDSFPQPCTGKICCSQALNIQTIGRLCRSGRKSATVLVWSVVLTRLSCHYRQYVDYDPVRVEGNTAVTRMDSLDGLIRTIAPSKTCSVPNCRQSCSTASFGAADCCRPITNPAAVKSTSRILAISVTRSTGGAVLPFSYALKVGRLVPSRLASSSCVRRRRSRASRICFPSSFRSTSEILTCVLDNVKITDVALAYNEVASSIVANKNRKES